MANKETDKNDESSQDIEYQLQAVIQGLPEGKVTLGEIIKGLGSRSFPFGILVFALPIVLPMPPGIPVAGGLIICVFAIQLLMSNTVLSIPNWIKQKSISKQFFITAHI